MTGLLALLAPLILLGIAVRFIVGGSTPATAGAAVGRLAMALVVSAVVFPVLVSFWRGLPVAGQVLVPLVVVPLWLARTAFRTRFGREVAVHAAAGAVAGGLRSRPARAGCLAWCAAVALLVAVLAF